MSRHRLRSYLLASMSAAFVAACGDDPGAAADGSAAEDTPTAVDAGDAGRVGEDADDTSDASDPAADAATDATDSGAGDAGDETAADATLQGDAEMLDDDGELDGRNGATGSVNGTTYTFTENVSWYYDKGNISAYQSLTKNWEIYGVPRAVGTYACNSDGLLPRVRLILGYQYYTTTDGGSCSIEVVSVSEDHIEGRFSGELRGALAPHDVFGTITGGVFRKRD